MNSHAVPSFPEDIISEHVVFFLLVSLLETLYATYYIFAQLLIRMVVMRIGRFGSASLRFNLNKFLNLFLVFIKQQDNRIAFVQLLNVR